MSADVVKTLNNFLLLKTNSGSVLAHKSNQPISYQETVNTEYSSPCSQCVLCLNLPDIQYLGGTFCGCWRGTPSFNCVCASNVSLLATRQQTPFIVPCQKVLYCSSTISICFRTHNLFQNPINVCYQSFNDFVLQSC